MTTYQPSSSPHDNDQPPTPNFPSAATLVIINLLLITAIGGAYYLLASRFTADIPLALGLAVAALAGLLTSLANYRILARRSSLRLHSLALYDWLYLALAFIVTVQVFLAINQLILAIRHPAIQSGHPYWMIALNLLVLGFSAHWNAQRLRTSQQPQPPEP